MFHLRSFVLPELHCGCCGAKCGCDKELGIGEQHTRHTDRPVQQYARQGTDHDRYAGLGQGGWPQVIRTGRQICGPLIFGSSEGRVPERTRNRIITFIDSFTGEGRLPASGPVLRPEPTTHAEFQAEAGGTEELFQATVGGYVQELNLIDRADRWEEMMG